MEFCSVGPISWVLLMNKGYEPGLTEKKGNRKDLLAFLPRVYYLLNLNLASKMILLLFNFMLRIVSRFFLKNFCNISSAYKHRYLLTKRYSL